MPVLSNPKHERFYVYTLACPETGEVFYVGKGCGKRAYVHEQAARNYSNPETPKLRRIRDILLAGKRPVVSFVYEGLTEPAAYMLEQRLIRQIGFKSLLNVLPGTVSSDVKLLRTVKHNLHCLQTDDEIRRDGPYRGFSVEYRLDMARKMRAEFGEIRDRLEAMIAGSTASLERALAA